MDLSLMPCNATSDRSILNDKFAQNLQHCLIRKFKRIPTAQNFANAFNSQTNHANSITRESARKWITGQAIPEFDRLVILQDWLNLDLNGFGKAPEEVESTHSLLPNDPNLERIKERHLKDFEELETLLHNALASFATRLR
jgi:hypothetical protein